MSTTAAKTMPAIREPQTRGAAKRGEADLTSEQLALALRHLWRPGWPRDLAAVLAHPLRGNLVRGTARQFSREAKPAVARYCPPTPAGAPALPATPTEQPKRQQAQRSPRGDAIARMAKKAATRFDARAAAANDLKDD